MSKLHDAMLAAAAEVGKLAERRKVQDAVDNATAHPLLWKAFQFALIHRYQKATGETVGPTFDWSKMVAWLIANWSTIMKLFLLIFGL